MNEWEKLLTPQFAILCLIFVATMFLLHRKVR